MIVPISECILIVNFQVNETKWNCAIFECLLIVNFQVDETNRDCVIFECILIENFQVNETKRDCDLQKHAHWKLIRIRNKMILSDPRMHTHSKFLSRRNKKRLAVWFSNASDSNFDMHLVKQNETVWWNYCWAMTCEYSNYTLYMNYILCVIVYVFSLQFILPVIWPSNNACLHMCS